MRHSSRSPRTWSLGLLALGIGIAGRLGWGHLGVADAFVPFAFPTSFDVANFVDSIRSGSRHSFLPSLMLDEVRKRVWILVPPLIALWIACRGTPPRGIVREPIVQAIAVLAAAMELIIGPVAKEGSGAHHYLPFLPVVALLAADIGRRRGIASHHPVGHRYRGVGGLLLVTWILVMGLGAARTQERFRSYMATRTGIEVRFARTSRESFDAGAIMDREETGIPIPEAAREKMRSRPFDWIVNPPGGPFFSMNSLYPLLRNLGRKGTVRTGPMRPSRRAPRRETTAAVK